MTPMRNDNLMTEQKNHLIITGAHPDVLIDITHIPKPKCCDFDYMVIGFAASGMHAIPSKYMATYHPVMIPDIKKRRQEAGGNTDYVVISHEKKEGVDVIEPLLPGERSGSSALLGAQAGLRLGYRRIVLCGCPMTGKNEKGGSYEGFRAGWEQKQKYLAGRVRSMSGWTRELLGEPTEEWLSEAVL